MTIQRQYILPNCSLVLEGLSADTSNVLSILANAEFKVIGLEGSLAGGSDFFKALVTAVSAYCQRLLSGVDHPDHMDSQSSSVVVEPDEGQYHRLHIKAGILNASPAASETAEPQTIRLSTVQLFDMAEAIDQFYADAQALPEFSMQLTPLPRKYVRATEPLVQRAIPPLLGFGTLAVAALGLFFLPVPELTEPDGLEQQDTATLETPVGTGATAGDDSSEQPASADDAADTEAIPVQNTAITDNAQLTALQGQVQQQLSDSIPEDIAFNQPLRYQISVAENGDIVGYNPLDASSLDNVDSTPLPALTYIPVENAAVGPMAQFDVTFLRDGTVEVASNQAVVPDVAPEVAPPEAVTPEIAPDSSDDNIVTPENSSGEESGEQSSRDGASTEEDIIKDTESTPSKLAAFVTTPIQDADRIYELNQQLRSTILSNRGSNWSSPAISYRIRLDDMGNITGYEADTTTAEQYATELKIPSLVKTAPGDAPQLDFLVVINDENVVEVSPWAGWPAE